MHKNCSYPSFFKYYIHFGIYRTHKHSLLSIINGIFHYFYLLLFEVINWFQRGSSLYIFITEPTVCLHENLLSKHFLENVQFILPKINSFLYLFTNQSTFPKEILEMIDFLHYLFYIIYLIINGESHNKRINSS